MFSCGNSTTGLWLNWIWKVRHCTTFPSECQSNLPSEHIGSTHSVALSQDKLTWLFSFRDQGSSIHGNAYFPSQSPVIFPPITVLASVRDIFPHISTVPKGVHYSSSGHHDVEYQTYRQYSVQEFFSMSCLWAVFEVVIWSVTPPVTLTANVALGAAALHGISVNFSHM